MTERRFMNAAEVLHPVMLLAMVFPLVCMLNTERTDSLLLPMYFLGYLLLPFAWVLRTAAMKVRTYGRYLLTAAVCIAAGAGLSQVLGAAVFPRETLRNGWTAAVAAELLVLFMDYDRLRRKEGSRRRALLENDLSWNRGRTAFERPSPAYALWFVPAYFMALLTACPVICNAAAASMAAYFALAVVYEWMRARTDYLQRVSYISHIPYTRIRKIGGAMVAASLVLMSLTLLPCAMTADKRQYRDLRKYRPTLVLTDEQVKAMMILEMGGEVFDPEKYLPEVETGEPDPVVNALFSMIGAGIIAAAVFFAVRSLRIYFAEFRDRTEDNGDRAETIREDAPSPVRISRSFRPRRVTDERERVREHYRRTIRKYRKDRPQSWETPAMIEQAAGISGTEEGEKLHRSYEKARYSG